MLRRETKLKNTKWILLMFCNIKNAYKRINSLDKDNFKKTLKLNNKVFFKSN